MEPLGWSCNVPRFRAMTDPTETLLAYFERRGADAYSSEAVTQEAHALQCAALAEAAGAKEALVVAALLHDVGHLIHNAGESLAARGIDAQHEQIAAVHLTRWFGPAVVEPVRLHVPAKRYLCATDAAYHAALSPASQRSLAVQGGAFDAEEAERFAALPFAQDAVALRRWDDLAKTPGAPTRSLTEYRDMIRRVAEAHPPA
jgi:phosphonate degradation associated HDIG domain protein